MKHLRRYFKKNPVIATVRGKNSFIKAIESPAIALFIIKGNILNLPDIMKDARKYDKLIFLHIDLLAGIGRDRMGVKYLAENNLCDGIVTTKSSLLNVAKKEGLMAIQRLFLLDSDALKTGEHIINKNKPDAVEILPGIVSTYFVDHVEELSCPVIAGGLIRTKQEVDNLLQKGILAISSSNQELWDY